MSDQIKIDFDALSRLSPQVAAVVRRLASSQTATVPTEGQTPSALAAQRVTAERIPKILGIIGTRMTDVSNLATRAARQFQVLDEQGLQAVATSTPTLLPKP